MKIKNILFAAVLRLCLIAIAMSTVSLAYAAHIAESSKSGPIENNLEPITSLSFVAEAGSNLAKNTYYDGYTWYKYGGDRSVAETGDNKIHNYDWKTAHAVVFKLAKGKYNITVNYSTAATNGGIWVYSGTTHYENFDSRIGYSKVGAQGSFYDYLIEDIEVIDPQLWRVSATSNSTTRLHSITVTKVGDVDQNALSKDFPSGIGAIGNDTFWYHNDGGGCYSRGESGSFYRYLVANTSAPYAPTFNNMVTINGKQKTVGVDGNSEKQGMFKTYEIKPGDAIGFKLVSGKEYRIKIYYYVGDNTADAELLNGPNVSGAWSAGEPIETDIKGDYGAETNTHLRTYHVTPYDGYDVYWVKNSSSESKALYLGGYEILPLNSDSPSGSFVGSWNIADESLPKDNNNPDNNADDDHKYVYVAQSHGNVALSGPTMAINDYKVGGNKSVMVNRRNFIGVNIPAGATLSFKYTADNAASGVTLADIDLSSDANAISDYNIFKNYEGEISYTNNSAQTKTVWIRGNSDAYAYFSGFTVTKPETQFSAIESDYVWYAVDREPVGAGNYCDDYTLITTDFQVSGSKYRLGTEVDQEVTINSKKRSTYRTGSDTNITFNIIGGKKGVINVYYAKGNEVNKFPLSEDGSNVKTSTLDFDGATIVQYHFDTTGGTKSYSLIRDKGDVWFGGFEVLFEEGNNGGIDLASGTYNCNGNSTVTNAISDDTYYILKSSNTTPVVGPSMLVNPLTEGDGVMLYTRGSNQNAIMFKMTGTTYNAVTVKGVITNGASIKIYKGSPSGTLLGTLTSTGSQTFSLGEGKSDSDVYYAVSNDDAGAYLISLAPATINENQLLPITADNIYKVNNQPADGQILNDKHTIFKGSVDAVDENGMMVLGKNNKAFQISNKQDYYGFKVGTSVNGAKTGYIKVYFKKGTNDECFDGNPETLCHKMEELPIDQPLGAGWNSSYDEKEHIITFNGEGGGRGWWFGTGNNNGTPRDLSIYNKINIELGTVTGSPNLKLVVQDSIGAGTSFKLDSNGRLTGDLTDQSKWFKSDDGKTFDIHKVSQIYIQDINGDNTTATVEIKSARLMRKPLTIATGTVGTDQKGDETYSTDNLTEVFGGIIHDVQGTHVYAYPFDLSKTDDNPQLYWVTGNINIAAIEVVYDDNNHFKVVDWYVNKDTKMIVGSDDPNWVWSGFDGKGSIGYPEGNYDEYVTFYISNGRPAHVSFIMPEAVAEVYDWESNNANYGKHVITPSRVSYNGESADISKITLDTNGIEYDRTGQNSGRNNIGTGSNKASGLYSWYSYDREISSKDNENCYMDIAIKATQKPAPDDEVWSDGIEKVDGKKGEWKILMRFISYQSPEISGASINENSEKVGETITVTGAGQGGNIYYTSDSSDPVNIASGINVAHTSTKEYGNAAFDIRKNCIVKAAQYLTTPYEFYEDAMLRDDTSKSMKLVSEDHDVKFDVSNVVYVQDEKPNDGKEQLFNRQAGGYMLTLPTGNKMSDVTPHEQDFNSTPHMYLTLGGKDHPYMNGNKFDLCGTNWKASYDNGLKTYLDSYKYKFDVDGAQNISPWQTVEKDENGNVKKDSNGDEIPINQNQNPYTECNGAPGGADTEAGGMFLQPISGTMLRFEPEYDGVITVWLRQNGCLDNNTQELGTFSRRPVYIMDENGRLMTRTDIKPTDEHYLGINGTWAINSNMCEERSQVEHTWLFAVAKQVFEKHPRYAERFKNFPNRWTMRDKYMTDDNSRGGAIMYGWWYKGFSINATTEDITSADFVSRYEYMDPNLLYRSSNVFDMEMNTLGLKNNFAKYGYELPNFQYVRYQIPVKAGKTYYIAGRGTKNGFSAIRFDRVKCNTNLNADDFNALRFSDNPSIYENTEVGKRDANYLKLKENWNDIGSDDSSVPTEKEINDSYVAVNNTSARYAVVSMNTENINDEGKYEGCEWFVNAIAGDAVSKNITGQPNLNGKTVQVILNRTFTAGNWHPIILPFSISETRLEQYFGEGTVVLYLDPYEHTVANPTGADGRTFISAYNAALDNSKLYFTRHRYEMLYANTPAFICPTFTWSDAKKKPATDNIRNNNLTWKDNNANGGVVVSIKFDRVTFDGSNINPDRTDGLYGYAINEEYEVVGSYDPQEISGDVYYIENYTQDGKPATQLKHSTKTNGTTVVMRPTRVWIQPIKSSGNIAPIRTVGAKTFSELDFDFDNEQAGISEIVADDITVERYINDNGVYDMLGRKMGEGSLDGLPSGVYIFKGQKVYVK